MKNKNREIVQEGKGGLDPLLFSGSSPNVPQLKEEINKIKAEHGIQAA